MGADVSVQVNVEEPVGDPALLRPLLCALAQGSEGERIEAMCQLAVMQEEDDAWPAHFRSHAPTLMPLILDAVLDADADQRLRDAASMVLK